MLTIQPKVLNNYHPVFKASEETDEKPISIADMDEDTYESLHDDFIEQKENFEDLAKNKDFKMPEIAKKALKGGAVITSGILGGMATGWGAKKSIGGFAKLKNTSFVKGIIKHFKATGKFIKESAKAVKTKFFESEMYKMPRNQWIKFGTTKVGGPVVKFFNTIGRGIKSAYNKVSGGIKHVYDKIRSIKKETWEKATVNTVGTSGGIASGVTALKEQKEKAGDED